MIATMNLSLACNSVVNKIVKKYTGGFLPLTGDVNVASDAVYRRCTKHEEIQLLVFFNNNSQFDQSHLPYLDEAIEKWEFENQGPKWILVAIRDLVEQHGLIMTEYSCVTTSAMAITHKEDIRALQQGKS